MKMTAREKAILALTILTAVGAIVYYGFLRDFIDEYASTKEDIAAKQIELKAQRDLLQKGEDIDKRYKEFEHSVLEPIPGKSLQAMFTEELNILCGPGSSISTHRVAPVPDPEAKDFAFLIIEVSRLEGDLKRLTAILKKFHARDLIVQELQLQQSQGRVVSNPTLTLDVTLAQLVRCQDLEPNDRKDVELEREKMMKSKSKRPSSSSDDLSGDERL